MYAITPNGVGKKVGARAIRPDWPLLKEETFTVDECKSTDVLAEDEVSLRTGAEEELNPPDTRTDTQKLEDSTGMNINQIKNVLNI